MSYNDYVRERDRWEAKGKVPKGTRRIMYNPYNGNFEYWKKGDDALLKLKESKDFEEVKKAYERDDNEREQELYGSFVWTRYSERQAPFNSAFYAGQGNNGRGNSGIEETEKTTVSEGSRRLDNGYDNEAKRNRITDSERSIGNDGALSDAKNQKARSTIASEVTVPITAHYSAGASADNNISHGNKNVKAGLLL